MAEAKFVLKEPNSKEPTLIYLFYNYNNQRLKYSTSEKIHPKFWNAEKQRAKETRAFPGHIKLNHTLDNLAVTVKDAYRDLVNSKSAPSLGKLKDALNKCLFKEEYSQKTTLLKFAADLCKTNAIRKASTIKQWKHTLKKLEQYKTYSKADVDFDTIDLNFYDKFVNYLTKEGYTKNTIGGFVKNIKIFMNEAVERKLTNNIAYKSRKFKVIEEQVDKIYLTIPELTKIYKMKFSAGNAKYEKVRDLFIIGCFTGLRFSDLVQVTPGNIINKGRQIKVRTEKTHEIVVIPLHRFVKEIIEKYSGNLPPAISNQKMNDYLKVIGELAEIQETVQIAITKAGAVVKETFKKYELITTHTARRSFATNAYLMDVPSIAIMKFTGHKTEKAFMRYIRISQEDNANKLINHPFFAN